MTASKFEVSKESLSENGVSIDYPILSPQKAELMASQVRSALKDSGKKHVVITGKTHFSIVTEVFSYISSQRKDKKSLFLALAPTTMMAYGLHKLALRPKEKGPGASYKVRCLEDVCEYRPLVLDNYQNRMLLAISTLYEYLNQIILTSKIPVGTINDEWDTFYTYSRSFDPSKASIIFINDIELFPTEQLILLMFILHEMRRRRRPSL